MKKRHPEFGVVRGVVGLVTIVATLLLAGACSDTTSPEQAINGSLAPTDTTVLLGASVTIEALIEYASGSRSPDSVAWTLSDSSMLELTATSQSQATVRSLSRGAAYVIAQMNGVFWDSTEVQVDVALAGALTPVWTSVFLGEQITVEAEVEYWSGAGLPDTVDWSVTDGSVLELVQVDRDEAVVRGLARGTAYVVALMNGEFRDSTEVNVGDIGDLRWRVERVGGSSVGGPALDGSGRIYTVSIIDGAPGTLTAVNPDGTVHFSVPSCWAEFSGAVLPDGTAYTNRSHCLQRHAPNGQVEWTVSCGTADDGIAVDTDGSALCVDQLATENEGRVLVRYSAMGVEQWRTLLGGTGLMEYTSAPVIASNGDIYVQWRNPSYYTGWLSRVTSDGTHLWTVPTNGGVEYSRPALFEDRIIVTYYGAAAAAYDTAGALLWEVDWGPGGDTSSPVVDADGNIYIQSAWELVSIAPNGSIRWEADSLNYSWYWASSVPTLLADGRLVVVCDLPSTTLIQEICAVNTVDGSLAWRSNIGGRMFKSVAVAPDGMIYVSTSEDLLAIWGRTAPLTAGWPTAGGGMHRLGRQ